MSFFRHKKTPLAIPPECEEMEIAVRSSVCTGEKTIGFLNHATNELMYAELVRGDGDIAAFYEKYGRKV